MADVIAHNLRANGTLYRAGTKVSEVKKDSKDVDLSGVTVCDESDMVEGQYFPDPRRTDRPGTASSPVTHADATTSH